MLKKLFCIGALLIMVIGVFCGCSGNKYNAVIYSDAKEWIDDAFLMENRVKGAYYLNDEYIEGESNPADKYVYDDTSPESRTLVITEEATFTSVFSKCAVEVNFDEQIVLLYVFADVYPSKEYSIKKIVLEGKNLNVYFKLKSSSNKDSTAPYQRCLMIRLDKLDITNVKFIK